uniref:hypothetical protein n=1 Tax=Xanthomonas sp. WCS2017Cala2-12 TaxID=3073639 RepID=UPI00288B2E3E
IMTQDELDRAVLEYMNSISYIKQAKTHGYNIPLATFQFLSGIQQRPADKLGVSLQTNFLEETIKDFLENERPISATSKKVHKWFSELITNHKGAINWELILMSDGNDIIEVLRTHYDALPNNIYWQMVSDCYTRSDLAHSDIEIIFD